MAAFTRFGTTSEGRNSERDRAATLSRRDAHRGLEADVKRVGRALRFGAGHVAVMAPDIEDAEFVVDAALERVNAMRVLRCSATTDHVESLIDDLFEANGADTQEGRVVVVIADADLASVKQLESIRVQIEATARGGDATRFVLVGTRVLQRILDLPSARALASRIGLRLVVAEKRGRFGGLLS